jgi:hypothetical protein
MSHNGGSNHLGNTHSGGSNHLGNTHSGSSGGGFRGSQPAHTGSLPAAHGGGAKSLPSGGKKR